MKRIFLTLIYIVSVFLLIIVLFNTYFFVKYGIKAIDISIVRFGVTSRDDKVIIPCIYNRVTFTNNGFFIAQKGIYYGVIDKENNIIIPFEYNKISELENGDFHVVKYNNKYTNTKSKFLINMYALQNNYFLYRYNDYVYEKKIKYDYSKVTEGVFNGRGDLVIPFTKANLNDNSVDKYVTKVGDSVLDHNYIKIKNKSLIFKTKSIFNIFK